MVLEEIKRKIENAHKVALFWHEHIDWDALGSMLWFWSVLEKLGKEVYYFTPDHPSRVFDFLGVEWKISCKFDYWEYDLLMFLDFSLYSRIPVFAFWHEDYFDKKEKVIIDHHKLGKTPDNSLVYCDSESISNCILLYEIVRDWWKELLDENIATYFFMGLATDSWNFRYDEWEQSVRSFRIAAELLELGAKKKLVIDEIFRSKSYRSVQFMQMVLQRMQKIKLTLGNRDINIIYSFYDEEELEKYWIDHDEADYGLHVMQDIRNDDLVVLLKKCGIFINWSLRWRWDIDCSELAKLFWWGGHINAAWYKIQSCWYIEKDVKDMMEAIKKALNENYQKLLIW